MALLLGLDASANSSRKLILSRLLWLRLVMLLFSFFALLLAEHFFNRTLPYSSLFGVLITGVGFLVITALRLKQTFPVFDVELLGQLLLDAAILAGLILFSGGATNPFVYYLLVLVAIAATVFSAPLAWVFSSITIVYYSVLLFIDLGAHAHHRFSDFQLHLLGMWVNFVGSAFLVTFFVNRLARSLKESEQQLSKVREKTLKNEQLVKLGTFAASTAHSLGTPLSTMMMLAEELKRSIYNNTADKSDEAENIALLASQIERCKRILEKLREVGDESIEHSQERSQVVTLQTFKELCDDHYRLVRPESTLEISVTQFAKNVYLKTNELFLHAIFNLIDNALSASNNFCTVSVTVDSDRVLIAIEDDGDGIPSDVANQWGKAFVSSSTDGLGIGIFLANASIENMDGTIEVKNGENQGTLVVVNVPRAQ